MATSFCGGPTIALCRLAPAGGIIVRSDSGAVGLVEREGVAGFLMTGWERWRLLECLGDALPRLTAPLKGARQVRLFFARAWKGSRASFGVATDLAARRASGTGGMCCMSPPVPLPGVLGDGRLDQG
jgi:hypothetical protein